jgi:osmotically-inducible protein OsmY
MKTYSSEEIIKIIIARLEHDTRVNIHRSPIAVMIENKSVILQGSMDSIAEKRAAVDTATRALSGSGQWRIIDRLHVKTTSHKENLELKETVALALYNEPVFREYTLLTKVGDEIETLHEMGASSREIMAVINDGCITLSGQVQSLSHRRLAEVLMWWLDGCEYVDNQLQIAPPEEDADNEITDAVRIVLEKDPLVHAGQLLVGTAGGVVVLNGSLASKEEKQLAIMDAWYVPGVADVVDRIEARS